MLALAAQVAKHGPGYGQEPLQSTDGSTVHTRHHRHLGLAESVWTACLEATDVPYALTRYDGWRQSRRCVRNSLAPRGQLGAVCGGFRLYQRKPPQTDHSHSCADVCISCNCFYVFFKKREPAQLQPGHS
eukprot:COSAG02_NODE_22612_length_746_cov_1.602782_1_plen_130_part_00